MLKKEWFEATPKTSDPLLKKSGRQVWELCSQEREQG